MKNRDHLDFEIEDIDGAVERVIRLGGNEVTRIGEYGHTWSVMADPDGKEFCLITQPDAGG